MADSITGRVIFNFFKTALFVICGTLFFIAWMLNKENLSRDEWPVTKGKVFYSQAVEKQMKVLGRNVKYYDLNIKYGYIVNKIRYDKKGLFADFPDKTLTKEFFIEQSKKFKKGDFVAVHYNPQNPKQSYLIADVDSGTRSFYKVTKDMLCFSIFLFLITPFLSLFKEKRYIDKNHIDQGLQVPNNAKRTNPMDRYR